MAGQLADLNIAEEGEELNPFCFSEGDYPPVDTVINHITVNKETSQIDLNSLSVNGQLVKDSINVYLNTKAVSSSACKEVLKSPLHFYHYQNTDFPEKEKESFNLGTFAHMAFLEPELFDMCVVEPKASLSSHEGCNTLITFWTEKLLEVHPNNPLLMAEFDLNKFNVNEKKARIEELKSATGLQCVNEDHAAIIRVLKFNYERYGGGIIKRLLQGAQNEISFYGTDKETGINVKIRPDAFQTAENIGVNAIISFKTTKAETVQKFYRDSANYQYELSEGMYLDVASQITGRNFNVVITIMLQTVPPYLPAVLYWDPDDLINGKYKYRSALQTIKQCEDNHNWPGFDAMAEPGYKGIINMKQPNWAMYELLPMTVEE